MTSLLRYLGSRRFASFLLVTWLVLALVWVVPFQLYGLPDQQIRSIVYGEPFFRVLYLLVAANAVACIMSYARSAWSRAQWTPIAGAPPRMTGGISARFARSSGNRAVLEALEAEGFRRAVVDEDWVWAVKNPWSPVGTVVFHTSLVLLLCGVMLPVVAPASRFQGNLVLAEGETFTGSHDAYVDRTAESSASPPPLVFTVEEVKPRFHEDMLLFTALEAVVRSGQRSHRVSVSRPWLPRPDTIVTLTDFGYALEVAANDGRGAESVRNVYKLKAFPSGQMDTIDIPVGTERYRVYVQIFGDYVDRNGVPGVRSFNADNPRILVSLSRILTGEAGERMMIEERLLRAGDRIDAPGISLTFPGLRFYGVFRVVRDPVAPLLPAVLLFALAGVASRLVFPRSEVLVVHEEPHSVVGVRSDFYGFRHAVARRIAQRLEGE